MFNATAPGYRGSHLAYGARFALTVVRLAGEKLAVTPFVGFGSTRATLSSGALAGLPAATPADTGIVIRNDALPIGVAAGWRFRLGAANALAVSLAPTYIINRRSGGSLDATNNTLRVAGVVELALAGRFGLTFSSELGKRAEAADPGPRGTRVGLARRSRSRGADASHAPTHLTSAAARRAAVRSRLRDSPGDCRRPTAHLASRAHVEARRRPTHAVPRARRHPRPARLRACGARAQA